MSGGQVGFPLKMSRRGGFVMALLGLVNLMACNEYCVTESFSAGCDGGQVIVMEHARFGRIALGRCVTRNYGHVGCSKDVISQLDEACSGRQRCALSVSDQVLVRTKPCPLDFSSYLEADYSCVKVQRFVCRRNRRYNVTTAAGYISSTLHPPGSHHCVYEFSFPPGQKINITMIDFSLGNGSVYSRSRQFCQQYAIIEEPRIGNSITVCGGETRVKHIYFSRTSQVNLRLVATQSAKFLIKYQVVGCPVIPLPHGTYSRQEDDALFITCNATRESFLLRCRNNEWIGDLKNCSHLVAEKTLEDDTPEIFRDVPGGVQIPTFGMSIVIIFGVALLIVVYMAIMVLCVLFIRRRLRNGRRGSVPTPRTKVQVLEDPYGHTHTISHQIVSARGHEERLPMLNKPLPHIRANCVNYADICEMHGTGSREDCPSNIILGSVGVSTPDDRPSHVGGGNHLWGKSIAASRESLRCVPQCAARTLPHHSNDGDDGCEHFLYEGLKSFETFKAETPLQKSKEQELTGCLSDVADKTLHGKTSSPDLLSDQVLSPAPCTASPNSTTSNGLTGDFQTALSDRR